MQTRGEHTNSAQKGPSRDSNLSVRRQRYPLRHPATHSEPQKGVGQRGSVVVRELGL